LQTTPYIESEETIANSSLKSFAESVFLPPHSLYLLAKLESRRSPLIFFQQDARSCYSKPVTFRTARFQLLFLPACTAARLTADGYSKHSDPFVNGTAAYPCYLAF
jgi:hypothetical protein